MHLGTSHGPTNWEEERNRKALSSPVVRYYFDLEHNDETTIVEEGMELSSIKRIRVVR